MTAQALARPTREEVAATSSSTLLHNMSVRPNTPLLHTGRSLHVSLALRVPDLEGLPVPPRGDVAGWARAWCRALRLEPVGNSNATLCAALDRAVARVGLPGVVPVLPEGLAHPLPSASVPAAPSKSRRATVPGEMATREPNHLTMPELDLDVVLAVFAKSSPKVFLAGKVPALSKLVPGRELVLALPKNWRLP